MKKFFLYITIGCTVLFASGCSKFLDQEPISKPTDQNFWKNEAEGNSAVAGIYALLRKAFTAGDADLYFAHGDYPSDEFNVDRVGGDARSAAAIDWSVFVDTNSKPYRSIVAYRRYDNFYRIIDQANRCIKLLPTIPLSEYTSSNPEAARDGMIAEAYFLRAYTYFYMSRVWGDVPLVLESVTDLAGAPLLARTPQAEVLAQCIKDCEAALPKASYGHRSAADRGIRANKSAVFALLAHIYAWQGNYAKVIPAADSVISKGGFALADRRTIPAMFSATVSSEGIFEIAMSSTTEGNSNGIAFKTLVAPYLMTNTSTIPPYGLDKNHLYSTTNPDALFTNLNDLRAQHAFAFMTTGQEPICIKYSNITYTQTGNQNPLARNNIIIFRLSDIILLKAEALAATSAFGDARTALNSIRTAAEAGNTDATDAGLFEAVIQERGRELFLEGHRFYDLIRLARAKQVYKFGAKMDAASFAAGKYYWPLDMLLLVLNPKLTQTPFWEGKL